MKLFVVVQLLSHIFLATKACTEIRLTSEDHTVVVGRSMEFMIDLKSNIIAEPKGHSHTAVLSDNCTDYPKPMTWQNKYGVIYLDVLNLPTVASDGMNTAGLSVGALLFPGFAKYQEVTKKMCKTPAISSLQFPLWILGNFATVAKVQEALKTVWFPLVFQQTLKSDDKEYSFELHYSIIDRTGAGIVIEFTDQGRKVHENTIGVMTNSPTYDFHMMNLRNYIHLSKYARDPLVLRKDVFEPLGEGTSLLGAPGDLTPTSRFVRTSILTHFAAPVNTSEEAVNLAVHILNTGDIPHGILSNHSHPEFADYTNWIVVKDLKNNALYYRTYEDLTVRVVYLDKVQPGKMLKLTLQPTIGGFKNTTDDMKPFKGRTELQGTLKRLNRKPQPVKG